MPDIRNNECLSLGDALFLYLEREGMPLNVASVSVFEGIIPLQLCRDFVESKIPLIPRYRQRVVMPVFNIGVPTWQYDRRFDIRNHIREITLKHGTEQEFRKEAAKILSVNMDRSRPLWDITLLRGLKGDRTGAVIRMHHSLADGISGVSLLNVLMDASPESPAIPLKKPKFRMPPERDSASALVDGFITSCFTAVHGVLTAQAEILGLAQQAVAAAGQKAQPAEAKPVINQTFQQPTPSLNDITRILTELATPADRLPFNRICRGPQTFGWTDISIAEITAVKEACNAKLNDVVLTVVTSALRKYAELHDVRTKGRQLRVVVPVSVWGKDDTGEMGNRITFLPVSLPMDIDDDRQLLATVSDRMTFLKSAHVAEIVGVTGSLLGAIPGSLQALVGPIASQLPLSVCNVICTNVPGPRTALHFIGHKMLSCYPYVPIGGEMGMNCAVLTYNGTAHFGFTGDVHAIPDLQRLPEFLTESFAELKKSVGVSSKPKRNRAPRKPRSKKRSTPPAPIRIVTSKMKEITEVPAIAPTAMGEEPRALGAAVGSSQLQAIASGTTDV